MITEDYCSFEVSKLLKEKGFNVPLWFYYDQNKEIMLASWSGWEEDWNNCLINNEPSPFISAPTHQMAMKWLREVCNIFIVIEPYTYDYVNEKNSSYIASLWLGDNYYENITSKDYPTYEKAVEESIKYCLENLI